MGIALVFHTSDDSIHIYSGTGKEISDYNVIDTGLNLGNLPVLSKSSANEVALYESQLILIENLQTKDITSVDVARDQD